MILDLKDYIISEVKNVDKLYSFTIDLTDIKDDKVINLSENDLIIYGDKKLLVDKIKFPLSFISNDTNFIQYQQLKYYDNSDTIDTKLSKLDDNIKYLNEKINSRYSTKSKLHVQIDAYEDLVVNRLIIVVFEIPFGESISKCRMRQSLSSLMQSYNSALNISDKSIKIIPIWFPSKKETVNDIVKIVFDSKGTITGFA